ncbi:methyltransferase domain-containing protein [Bacillus sp. B15-48]|uniref:methyltransferase domain-containing protein n=1 Tax=Bacillus sp. B15-48 TaxID=1548601 RepID=UPI00193FC793|nr:methyltransferase domain-containing protein [Bacillus sp. B15-48]
MDAKTKWNVKYLERVSNLEQPEPNARLKEKLPYLSGGTALDLACGLGGNSLFLAGINYEVQALDISDVAIKYLEEQVEKFGLNIHPHLTDLTDIPHLNIAENSFDLVVVTYYLERSLFPLVKSTVKSKGYFFMETFFHSPNNSQQSVSNQFKLNPQELLISFSDWKILYYEENEQEGRQTLFCQKTSK